MNRPLSILHVIPAVAERYGGPSRAVVALCRALGERGVQTLIAATDADGPGALSVPLGQPVTFQGIGAIFFRRQFAESLKVSFSFSRWLAKRVRDFDAVHIHAVFSHCCFQAAARCRDAGVPYVFRPLGTLDPWSLAQKPLRKRFFLILGLRGLLENASAIHYTTPEEAESAERTLGLRHRAVIPLGVEDEFFEAAPAHPELSRTILALSRLHPKKNLDVLIQAFAEVAGTQGFEDWRLVIAGDGPAAHRASLEAQAKRLLGDRVVFTGWLDRGETARALRAAALFVSPSSQENFGLSVAEAMSCGLPVVVGPGVNLSGQIQEAQAGWVTRPLVPSLSDTLREAMASPEERLRRGKAARAFAESRFRWSQVAASVEDLYRSFLPSRLEIPA